MRLPGLTSCGSRIQRASCSVVFGNCPATVRRPAIPPSGGPTRPCATGTPGTAWQATQPYSRTSSRPRAMSPVTSAVG